MLGKQTSRTGNPEQRFRDLYRAHYMEVYAYFRRRTDSECARDGTAETFLVAWRRLDDVLDADRTLPWLYGVAKRVLANQRRSQERQRRLNEKLTSAPIELAPGPETVVVRSSHIQEVLDALSRLRLGDREVIRLAQWEGLSHAEIATALGCKPHAVDQRMHRAMRRLAHELESSRPAALRDRRFLRKGGTL